MYYLNGNSLTYYVVKDWDKVVRSQLPLEVFWFAPLSHDTGEIDPTCFEIGEHKEDPARKNLQAWLEKVGLPLHSPHKFRHGHVHFAMAHAKIIEDHKVISLNVMHSKMEITDQFYSVLNDNQVHDRISSISKEIKPMVFQDESLLSLFREFILWKESNIRGS